MNTQSPVPPTAQPRDHRWAELLELGTATVFEAQGRRGAVSAVIHPIDPSMRLVGHALTVRARPGDNLILHFAIECAKPGDVLVVDANGYVEAGILGDLMAACALQRGVAGLVVDGAVRDSQALVDMGFPAFARGVCIKDSTKCQAGQINVPLDFCGVRIEPGDVIIGDRDGLVVVEADNTDTVLETGRARAAKEDGVRAQIRLGRSTLEIFGLDAHVRALGIESYPLHRSR